MRDAYTSYGHEMPCVFFTDNVAGDKTFIENILPSLKNNVSPRTPEELSNLYGESGEVLELPMDVEVVYINRNYELIDNEIGVFLSSAKSLIELGQEVSVGLDCEWTDLASDRQLDILQIAYDKKVYVIHLDNAWATLPLNLLAFLKHSGIKKWGKNVGGDFGRLNKRFNMKCKSGCEVGSFCSARKCIPSGHAPLSDISFRVLGFRISKDDRLNDWSSAELSSDQIKYAAIDAWAGLCIYNVAKDMPEIGTRLNEKNCMPGTYVALKPAGVNRPIAFGEILRLEETSTRRKIDNVIVKVHRVSVPGFIPNESVIGNVSNSIESLPSLGSFGAPPFEIKLKRKVQSDYFSTRKWCYR